MRRRGFLAALMSLPLMRWVWGDPEPYVELYLKPEKPLNIKIVDISIPSRKLKTTWMVNETWIDIYGNQVTERLCLAPPGEIAVGKHAYKLNSA